MPHLSWDEVKRFYSIWFLLLHYVNQKKKLVKSFPAEWGKVSVRPEDALPLRDALWADDSLREAFIAENPAKLSPADLSMVESWKYRVMTNFFIFRYQKKHTIFLAEGSPARAYGVIGLTDSFEDFVGTYLPIYVKAVLLPFEDRIIYDGLLLPYPVMFGSGIKRDLDETYRFIDESEGVITSLLPGVDDPAKMRKNIQTRNKKTLTAFQKELGRSGLSPKMIEQHGGNIVKFAESLLAQNPPRGILSLTLADVKAHLQANKDDAVSFKRFARFLRDTGRMGYDEAEDLLEMLKNK
jgi:hypothetical protein